MALAPDNAALAALVANYQAAQTVKAVWAQASAAFEAVQDNLPTLAEGVNTAAASLRQTAEQISAAMSATGGEIDLSSLLTLASGLGELAQNYAAFHEGLVSYTSGVDTLAGNWSSVYSGIRSLAGGAGELSSGVSALDAETSQIPELIGSLTGGSSGDDEDGSGSERASFLDERNTDTASVQFVIMTDGISAPEEPAGSEPVAEDLGFFENLWNKFLDLFRSTPIKNGSRRGRNPPAAFYALRRYISNVRYCIASARCAGSILSLPSRSAIVRATRSIRS